MTLRGGQKLLGRPGFRPGRGAAEEGSTPRSPPPCPGRLRPPRGSRVRRLPAAWPVGTPPSARQAGAPTQLSTQVRRVGLFARPRPSPGASHRAGRLPSAARPLPLPGPVAGGPSDPRPAAPAPPARRPPAPPASLPPSFPPAPGEGAGGSPLEPGAPLTFPPPPSSCSAMFMVQSGQAAP